MFIEQSASAGNRQTNRFLPGGLVAHTLTCEFPNNLKYHILLVTFKWVPGSFSLACAIFSVCLTTSPISHCIADWREFMTWNISKQFICHYTHNFSFQRLERFIRQMESFASLVSKFRSFFNHCNTRPLRPWFLSILLMSYNCTLFLLIFEHFGRKITSVQKLQLCFC